MGNQYPALVGRNNIGPAVLQLNLKVKKLSEIITYETSSEEIDIVVALIMGWIEEQN